MLYLLEFFIFSFLGWIIDSAYSSLVKKKWISSGYFRGVPLCPIYGLGGILLLNSFALSVGQPAVLVILETSFLIVVLEYVGGWLSENILDEKLWDYSDEPFHVNGYISAWSSFLWVVAVAISYQLVGTHITTILGWLEPKMILNQYLEVMGLFVFFAGAFWVTGKNKKLRLAKRARQRLSEMTSLDDLFDIEKLRSLTEEKRKELVSDWSPSNVLKKIQEWEKTKGKS